MRPLKMCVDVYGLIRRQKQGFLKRYSLPPPNKKVENGLYYLSMVFFREPEQHHTKEERSVILSCLNLAVQL